MVQVQVQSQTQGGKKNTYNQIYALYNIDSQDMQTIQGYINQYFMDNNYFQQHLS